MGIIREDSGFYKNLKLLDISDPIAIEDNYAMLQGKRKNITYKANQYTVHLQNKSGYLMDIIMARRKNNTWFVVGINGENKPKTVTIDLSFIEKQNGFIITDGDNGFNQKTVLPEKQVTVNMDAYGGIVMKF